MRYTPSPLLARAALGFVLGTTLLTVVLLNEEPRVIIRPIATRSNVETIGQVGNRPLEARSRAERLENFGMTQVEKGQMQQGREHARP